MRALTPEEYFFFDGRREALPLYETLRTAAAGLVPDLRIGVKKTQISLFNRRMFAAVSFLPVRRAAARPKVYITLTLGLPARLGSPRVDAASEPYPGRWTHHILIGRAEEIDEELLRWLREASDFARCRR